MHRSWHFLAIAAFGAFSATVPAGARTVHLACRDGISPPVSRCVAGCGRPLRCDTDARCDDTCSFAIRVCGEVLCRDELRTVPVGKTARFLLSTALGARPTRFVLRCHAHPPRLSCPTTSTSTSSSSTPALCPTTTTLGLPSCGGTGVCNLLPCLSGQSCADTGAGQCGCVGPVHCGGVYLICGGDCPGGQTCTALPTPEGCPSIGCTCQ